MCCSVVYSNPLIQILVGQMRIGRNRDRVPLFQLAVTTVSKYSKTIGVALAQGFQECVIDQFLIPREDRTRQLRGNVDLWFAAWIRALAWLPSVRPDALDGGPSRGLFRAQSIAKLCNYQTRIVQPLVALCDYCVLANQIKGCCTYPISKCNQSATNSTQ